MKHYWLYVLKLEQEKYYVGQTSQKDPQKRIMQHMNGFYTSQWAKQYSPTGVAEIIDVGVITKSEVDRLELQRTRQYMKKYGLQSTRGGKLNYSGKYVRIGDRFWREKDFQGTIGLLAMTVAFTAVVMSYITK